MRSSARVARETFEFTFFTKFFQVPHKIREFFPWLHVQRSDLAIPVTSQESVVLPVRVQYRMCSHGLRSLVSSEAILCNLFSLKKNGMVQIMKLRLHCAIYQVRFYSNLLIHVSTLSISYNDIS